jgi:dephospho-CoA kinase
MVKYYRFGGNIVDNNDDILRRILGPAYFATKRSKKELNDKIKELKDKSEQKTGGEDIEHTNKQ